MWRPNRYHRLIDTVRKKGQSKSQNDPRWQKIARRSGVAVEMSRLHVKIATFHPKDQEKQIERTGKEGNAWQRLDFEIATWSSLLTLLASFGLGVKLVPSDVYDRLGRVTTSAFNSSRVSFCGGVPEVCRCCV